MPAPNQRRFRGFPAHPVHHSQFLPDRQPLFHNGHASLRADIHCVPVRAQGLSALLPLHNQLHPRIQPSSRPDMLTARLFRQSIKPGHSRLPLLNARRLSTATQRALPGSIQQTHLFLQSNVSTPSTSVNGTSPHTLPTSNTNSPFQPPIATTRTCHPDRSDGAVCRRVVEGPRHDLNPATNLDGIFLSAPSSFTSLPSPP